MPFYLLKPVKLPYYTAFLIMLVLVMSGCTNNNLKEPTMVYLDSQQLLVVTTEDWTTTHAVLTGYELVNGEWKEFIPEIKTRIGRTGLAWAPGLHDSAFHTLHPLKQEGDGKSPAGIFPLESLYGYEDFIAKMPYLKVDTNTFCVDDPASQYYNKIVRGDEVEKDWSSAETMRMESDVYKYGIIVGYNTEKPVPGAGSCIFIHLTTDTPTAGCTAMTEAELLEIISFLDIKKNPLLVQAPDFEYDKMAKKYHLPQRKK